MDEFGIDDIPSAGDAAQTSFEPFGSAIKTEEIAKRLSNNLYIQLSDDSDRFVLDAVTRAETYVGTVLSYLRVKFDLDDRVIREIVLMQTVYELHMALGHEEAGREYRIQAKNTIIAAYGSFPDADNTQTVSSVPAAAVAKPRANPRAKQLHRARGFTL